MTPPTVRGSALGAALVLASTLLLASCTSGHGTAGADQQIAASCPSRSIASTTGIDVTGSFHSDGQVCGCVLSNRRAMAHHRYDVTR